MKPRAAVLKVLQDREQQDDYACNDDDALNTRRVRWMTITQQADSATTFFRNRLKR